MEKISREEIKKLYALAARAGLLESGRTDDAFHQVVQAVTGKTSVRELTEREAAEVKKRLLAGTEQSAAGKMSSAQIKKAWCLLYQIIEASPNEEKSAGERMCGAIQKILGIEARVQSPFAWISEKDGSRLIEMLKRYLRSARARAGKEA